METGNRRTALADPWLEDAALLLLLLEVIEFTGSASFPLEFSRLLVLAIVELEVEATKVSLFSFPPPSNSYGLDLNTGDRLILAGPSVLVNVGFLFVVSPSLSLNSELEEFGLGCLFVAGSRAFGFEFGLGTETSVDDALVLLFLCLWSAFDPAETGLLVGNLKGDIGAVSRGVGVDSHAIFCGESWERVKGLSASHGRPWTASMSVPSWSWETNTWHSLLASNDPSELNILRTKKKNLKKSRLLGSIGELTRRN